MLSRTSPASGRRVVQHTAGRGHSYPLYYFVPSITADRRHLVYHREGPAGVQLHRLGLTDGSDRRLTDGRARDAGWAIWCEPRLHGVHTHLSALDPARGTVYFFDQRGLHAVDVATGAGRLLTTLDGRIPVGQSAVSPDGRRLAFVDADRTGFTAAYADRERRERAGTFRWADHDPWRRTVPTRICTADTRTGELTVVSELDFHVHHLLFVDDATLLVNHERDGNGMWTLDPATGATRSLRPADEHGRVCHQVVAGPALLYETSRPEDDVSYFGRYDLGGHTWREWRLPAGVGYVHTGNDPAGTFLVIEGCAPGKHGLYRVLPGDRDEADVELLHELNPAVYDVLDQQRHHAHPFLSPDRTELFFTDVLDGRSQICSLDVADLTGAG